MTGDERRRRGDAEKGHHGIRWIVDGMNVIGSRPDRWWNDPDAAVRRLIEELDRYGSLTRDDITVVFDRRPPHVTPGRHGAALVAFASRRGRIAADHEIVAMVEDDPDPGSLSVVTSDARLAEQVRSLGARVSSSGTFRRRLDQAVGEGSRGVSSPGVRRGCFRPGP